MATVIPYIPQQITVHLGPPNSDAENVTVSFVDYVKNAPEDVMLMQNFDDRGYENQLGVERQAMDYWLSYVGPSELFTITADAEVCLLANSTIFLADTVPASTKFRTNFKFVSLVPIFVIGCCLLINFILVYLFN